MYGFVNDGVMYHVLQRGLLALSVEVPSGMRDAGVNAVNRFEALLRRWACFVGGTLVLFRVLIYPFWTIQS